MTKLERELIDKAQADCAEAVRLVFDGRQKINEAFMLVGRAERTIGNVLKHATEEPADERA